MSQEVGEKQSEETQLQQVREYILAAAQILKALGPEKARVGWMLEDSLMYLDELALAEEVRPTGSSSAVNRLEKLNKLAQQ